VVITSHKNDAGLAKAAVDAYIYSTAASIGYVADVLALAMPRYNNTMVRNS
jgi:hypothetical protein